MPVTKAPFVVDIVLQESAHFGSARIEKARAHGYNYLKGRIELIERLGNEMVEQINQCLDPQKIEAGQSDLDGLRSLLRQRAAKVASVTDTLGPA